MYAEEETRGNKGKVRAPGLVFEPPRHVYWASYVGLQQLCCVEVGRRPLRCCVARIYSVSKLVLTFDIV